MQMARKKVYRAGVIPFLREDEDIQMLFMKPSDGKFGGNTFQIAKGRQEEGENIEETALREAKEELGLFIGNIVQLHNLGVFLGRTTVYIAEVKNKDMFGDPGSETGAVKWMTLEDFLKEGRDLHKPVVRAAHRNILKMYD